jgi:hypothetical protein
VCRATVRSTRSEFFFSPGLISVPAPRLLIVAARISGTPRPDTFAAECGARADEYFWLNGLHPTTPVHDALAFEMARMLQLSGVVDRAFRDALGKKDRSVDGEE